MATNPRATPTIAPPFGDLVAEAWTDHTEALRPEVVALTGAVDNDQLLLHYQPEVSLEDGTISGVEALARWDHPARGLVPPGEFIPLAEATDLIQPIGRWVLSEALTQAARWRRRYPGRPPLEVSVNLSPHQVTRRGLAGEVARLLETTGTEPDLLNLEITESAAVEDHAVARGSLAALKVLGVRLTIDDFGTGYSSFGYLKRFPVDTLKLDRSFIAGLGSDRQDTAIVLSVLGLAHALGLSVVAEGVETQEQVRMLRDLGCEAAQGFYFARPGPPDEVEALLGRDPSW